MIFQDFNPEVVILGGGDFPTHDLPLSLLDNAQKIVCCDGAAFEAIRHEYKPWRIIGDCDSILSPQNQEEEQMLHEHQNIIRRYTGQDDNDQTKAVRYCIEHGLKRIAIVGSTGKREDHTLGNISLLIDYMEMGADIRLYTDYGLFIPCHDRITIDVPIPEGFVAISDKIAQRQKSTQISIFNISAKQLKAEGLRYPLSDFTRWWQGTLNEAVSTPITIEGGGDFLVYICYD